ncbi:MAG: type II secretion system protein [Candidatus Omnitrophota bacterium]|nr:MAG: type II secretion system protein [Candidatus Omnitrophota bacterium]
MPNRKRAFTLVELIIATSILAIGIVFVSRSFLTMVGALDTSSNKIKAVQFLESKMGEVEQQVLEQQYIEQQQVQADIMIGNRSAEWELVVEPLDLEDELTLQEEIEEQVQKGETINTAQISVTWQEENKQKEAVLATYFLSNESIQDLDTEF